MDASCSSDEKTPLTRVPSAPASSGRRRVSSASASSCLSDDEPADPFCPPSKKGIDAACGLGCCDRLKAFGNLFKKCFLVAALLAAVVVMGIIPEADQDSSKHKFNISTKSGPHRIHLDDWSSPVRLSLRGPFLHPSLANATHVFTTVALLKASTSNLSGNALTTWRHILRVPTVPVEEAIAGTSFLASEVFTCKQYHTRCDLLVEVHGSPPEVSYPVQSQLEPSEVEFGLSIFLAASVLMVLYMLIVFEVSNAHDESTVHSAMDSERRCYQ
ncbi:hypothetical protein V5799_013519 [Amblyomma americanum]|uniref:Transmembrane protein n=1 Tax=Amblyomma americanum TaxID=6943 RepID=A0AAQ4E5P7_AMBAM